jgi:hypothetical protein
LATFFFGEMQKFLNFKVSDECQSFYKKVPKKRHIEYGHHLEFLRKKIFYKNKVLRQHIKQKKKFDKKDGLFDVESIVAMLKLNLACVSEKKNN